MLGLIVLLQGLAIAVSGPATSAEYLPLHVAEAHGAFARAGLTVTLARAGSEGEAAEALAEGKVDLAATSVEAALRRGRRVPADVPQLVLGLTAAPPVALLVASGHAVESVRGLRGLRVAIAAPGAPEHAWLLGLLRRADVRVPDVELVSLGSRGLTRALQRGDAQAGLVDEPWATRLLVAGDATMLADLRTPDAAAAALGRPTVHAALFARDGRAPDETTLQALERAVGDAQALIGTMDPAALAARLPREVVGNPGEFAARLEATRRIYLPEGRVSAEQLAATIEIIRGRLPFPPTLAPPPAKEMLRARP